MLIRRRENKFRYKKHFYMQQRFQDPANLTFESEFKLYMTDDEDDADLPFSIDKSQKEALEDNEKFDLAAPLVDYQKMREKIDGLQKVKGALMMRQKGMLGPFKLDEHRLGIKRRRPTRIIQNEGEKKIFKKKRRFPSLKYMTHQSPNRTPELFLRDGPKLNLSEEAERVEIFRVKRLEPNQKAMIDRQLIKLKKFLEKVKNDLEYMLSHTQIFLIE